MSNIFDDETLNIDEYKPDSIGVGYAKKSIYSKRICIIAAIFSLGIWFYLLEIKHILNSYLVPEAIIYGGLFMILFCIEVLFLYRNMLAHKIFKFTDQEKFDFNYYLLYKMRNKGQWVINNYLLSLGINSALMGSKEKCKDALELIPEEYQPQELAILKEWYESEETVIDRKRFNLANKVANPLRYIPLFFEIDFGLLTACIDYKSLVLLGATRRMIGILGIFQCAALVLLCVIIAALLIFQNSKNKTYVNTFKLKKIAKFIIGIFAMILIIYCVLTNGALNYGFGTYKYVQEENIDSCFSDEKQESIELEESHNDEDASYVKYTPIEYSIDYADTYDTEDYDDVNEDEQSLDELEIMNKMIILCNFLQKNGVINDFSVELGYNAKGRVKGTVAQDEKYVYVLYDNGNKQNKSGNNCIELVLEAEPLDENGVSLGQTEAALKGFYLVDLETGEVTDEQKTHW